MTQYDATTSIKERPAYNCHFAQWRVKWLIEHYTSLQLL